MTRFSIRNAVAAIVLSVSTLAAAPSPAALAVQQSDLGVRVTTASSTVFSHQEVAFQVHLTHTDLSESGGTVEILLPDYFQNVHMGPMTGGYACSKKADTFFGSGITKVTCVKGLIGNDLITVIAKMPAPGQFGVIADVHPTNAVDPDDSDNVSSIQVLVKIPAGGIPID